MVEEFVNLTHLLNIETSLHQTLSEVKINQKIRQSTRIVLLFLENIQRHLYIARDFSYIYSFRNHISRVIVSDIIATTVFVVILMGYAREHDFSLNLVRGIHSYCKRWGLFMKRVEGFCLVF